jgi:hypothetical protein
LRSSTYEHVPEKSTIVDAEDLSGTLTSHALVNKGKSGVSGQESGHGHTSGSGLGKDRLLLSAAYDHTGCKIKENGGYCHDQLADKDETPPLSVFRSDNEANK